MKRSFIPTRDIEISTEEKHKERVMDYWDECNKYFSIWINDQGLLNSWGQMAIDNGEVEKTDIINYIRRNFSEQVRENFGNYSSFCSYSMIVWNLVKIELKNVSPKEKKEFTKKIQELRNIRDEYEKIQVIFDQLSEYVSQYMPIRPPRLDQEMRL